MIGHVSYPKGPLGWVNLLWGVWALVWVLSALTAKRTRTGEPAFSRLLYLIPIIVAAMLLFAPEFRVGVLVRRFAPPSPALQWTGAAFTTLGIAYTFWARIHLGRNWSGQVVIKEQHELIRTGPYSSVRHPIYTGLLLGLAGTALVIGEVRALIALALITYHFIRKARREEAFMSQEFGEEYARYRSQSGMLLPRFR
jgi:protein-S-isoprenylcysteine O-methyltransferase Ste14